MPNRIGDVNKKLLAEDIRKAKRIFNQMKANGFHNTSILIESQRVNFLVEYFVADLFGCTPFSQPKVKFGAPFYLLYRQSDRRIRSCFGGLKNPLGRRSTPVPGIYYLNEKEKWITCSWKENEQDAAVVITLYDPGTKAVKMAAFGFSGRATDAVGDQLILDKGHFWPPPVKLKGKQIGIYICRYDFVACSTNCREEVLKVKSDIIALDEEMLRKYLR